MGNHATTTDFSESGTRAVQPDGEVSSSGVSWGAVIGGAFVASALYLILLALGAGFGLAAISPWSYGGETAAAAGVVALVWLVIIEIVASAFGGYLTGRLRTRWVAIHSHEVFFRDTANGFLAWAVALVVSVAFLSAAAASMAGSAAQARTSLQGGSETGVADQNMYFVDTLFRSDRAGPARVDEAAGDAAVKAEAARIVAKALKQPQIAPTDQDYLTRVVAARTGLSQADAAKRVSEVISQVRQAEDAVRKATARLLLWLFVSLLMGAFSASYAATIGGRQRDHVKAI